MRFVSTKRLSGGSRKGRSASSSSPFNWRSSIASARFPSPQNVNVPQLVWAKYESGGSTMKDSQGVMLRERWKENGNPECAHTSLSQERSFGGVITGSYICTICGAQTIPNGVEASCVLELNMFHRFIERRKARHVLGTRGLASFIAADATLENIEGDAILHDLSLGGCRLEAEQLLVEGQLYYLTLHIPPQTRLIHVRQAM